MKRCAWCGGNLLADDTVRPGDSTLTWACMLCARPAEAESPPPQRLLDRHRRPPDAAGEPGEPAKK